MKVLSLILSLSLFASCSSLDSVKKNANCVVWKDQKVWGPASIEVIGKTVSWIGGCRGMHWDCKNLKIRADEDNNVMAEEIPTGFIENNVFKFFPDQPFAAYVSSAEYKANPEALEVTSSKINFRYNDKCTPEQALIGAIAVDIIGHIQKAKD
jgi:hypothetical protein